MAQMVVTLTSLILAGALAMFVYHFYPTIEAKIKATWDAHLKYSLMMIDKLYLTITYRNILFFTFSPCILFASLAFMVSKGFGVITLVITLAFAWLGLNMFRLILSMLWQRRLLTFDSQLVDGLNLIANSLKSGLNLDQSISVLTKEMSGPIAQEFQFMLNQKNLGLSIDEALEKMLQRIPSNDLSVAIHSVLILRETGGDLTETFDVIASTIRERRKVDGQIQSMTAQGKLQGIILLFMPLVFALIVNTLSPGYFTPMLSTTIGWIILLLVVVLQIIGFLWIKKIVTIEV